MNKRSDTWIGNKAGFLDIPIILTAILRTLEEIRDKKEKNND